MTQAKGFRLCRTCLGEIHRWHDLKPSQLHGIRIMSIGQNNADNVISANRARIEDYYALLRRQERMIRERCARDHQVAPGIVPLPDRGPGQLDLFGIAS